MVNISLVRRGLMQKM